MLPDARPGKTRQNVKAASPEIAAAATPNENDERFLLALSHEQVQELIQQDAANRGGGRGILGVLLMLGGVDERLDLDELMQDEHYHDRRISQSVIRGLLVLGVFASGEVHGLNDVAGELGMVSTTTWRYLKTWVALGVLEERKDRRYRLTRRWMGETPQSLHRNPNQKKTTRPKINAELPQ